jgi:hypothetical protein
MKLSEFKSFLSQNFEKNVRFVLPTGTKIPPHTHVTEIARIEKKYVDCGGTFRSDLTCRMQAWFQDDTDHRLTAGKLLAILHKAASFLESDDIDVELEYEAPFVSQFPVIQVQSSEHTVLVTLGTKHTACLAEEKCLPPALNKKAADYKNLPTLHVSKCC